MLASVEELLWIAGLYLVLVCGSIFAARIVASHALLADWSERSAQHRLAMAAGDTGDRAAIESPVRDDNGHLQPEHVASPATRAVPAREFAAPVPDRTDWSETRRRAFDTTPYDSLRPIGLLRIPAIGVTAPIMPGSDDDALNVGVGWLDQTAAPGTVGNAALAAHRDGFFRRLGELQEGDSVLVDTLAAEIAYVVTARRIVDPDNVGVLAPSSDATLTLITCYPFRYVGNAPQRYIVRAKRASENLET